MILLSLVGCLGVKVAQHQPTADVVESEAGVEEVSPIPVPGPLPSWTPPVPEVSTLSNGVEVWLLEDHDLPLVSVRLLSRRGSLLDAEGAEGLTALYGEMLEESAGDLTAIEMKERASSLAIDLSTHVERLSLVVSLDSTRATLDDGLSMMADMVLRPALNEEDWERVKGQRFLELLSDRQDGMNLASEIARREWYAEGNPWGRPVRGTPESVDRLELHQVQAHHETAFESANSALLVVGDLTMEEAVERFERSFEGWEQGGEELALPEAETAGAKVLLVDDPGATQTAIRVVGEGPALTNIERHAARMTGVVMGGSFTSRLNSLLREEKGYTYGARAWFSSDVGGGTFNAGTLVRGDATSDALRDLLSLLRDSAQGFSEGEREKARAQVLSGSLDRAGGRRGIAAIYLDRMVNNRPAEGLGRDLELTMSASAAEMQVVAERFLEPSRLVVTLAGDLATVGPMLDEAGVDYTAVAPTP